MSVVPPDVRSSEHPVARAAGEGARGLSRYGILSRRSDADNAADGEEQGHPELPAYDLSPLVARMAQSMVVVHQEIVLSDAQFHGIQVDLYGRLTPVLRRPSVPWSEVQQHFPSWTVPHIEPIVELCYSRQKKAGCPSDRYIPADTMDQLCYVLYGSPDQQMKFMSCFNDDPTWTSKQRDMALDQWRAVLPLAIKLDSHNLGNQQRAICGTGTWEVIKRSAAGRLIWTIVRAMCGSHRCPHCSRRMALKERTRLERQLAQNAGQGAAHPLFMTLTLDPNDLAADLGLSRDLTVSLAWKVLHGRLKKFFRALRTLDKNLEYALRVEGHGSGFPHAHVLVVSRKLESAILADAKCKSIEDLLSEMEQREAVVVRKIEAWEAGGMRGRKPPRRVPFTKFRQRIKSMAVEAGFGSARTESGSRVATGMFWVEPVRDLARMADYLLKDTSFRKVAGEVSKARQVEHCDFPRNTRTWRFSRNWWTLPEHEHEHESEGTVVEAVYHRESIDSIRARLKEKGVPLGHEVISADMASPARPARGGKWPTQLQSFCLTDPRPEPIWPINLCPQEQGVMREEASAREHHRHPPMFDWELPNWGCEPWEERCFAFPEADVMASWPTLSIFEDPPF